MPDFATLADDVLDARLRRAWSRQRLAAVSKVDVTTIFRIETGATTAPQLVTVRRLAKALKTDAIFERYAEQYVERARG